MSVVLLAVTQDVIFIFPVVLIIMVEACWTILFHKKALDIETPIPNIPSQPYHPSVVFFNKPWNGWKYWMVFTPMPLNAEPYPDRWENPCVVSSNDGINWAYPNGEIKSIDDLTEDEIAMHSYYSDPDMVYCEEYAKLRVYYRKNSGADAKDISLYFQESSDGINWGGRRRALLCDDIIKHRPVSPTFVYKKNKYEMWFVTEGGDKKNIYYSTSTDGLAWYNIHICCFLTREKLCNPWHIDCQQYIDKYIMTIYELSNSISVWESNDGLIFTFVRTIIHPNKILGSFYNGGLYRACMVKTAECYRVFFSARNRRKTFIGIAEGKNISDIHIINGTKRIAASDFFFDYVYKYTQSCRGIIKLLNLLKSKCANRLEDKT